MEKYIKQIEALIEANRAIKERTPFLEVSLGGLRCAQENAQWHIDELARQAKAAAEKTEAKPTA